MPKITRKQADSVIAFRLAAVAAASNRADLRMYSKVGINDLNFMQAQGVIDFREFVHESSRLGMAVQRRLNDLMPLHLNTSLVPSIADDQLRELLA